MQNVVLGFTVDTIAERAQFCVHCRCQCVTTGMRYALKRITVPAGDDTAAAQALRELRGLQAVKGISSCVQLHELILTPTGMDVILECASSRPQQPPRPPLMNEVFLHAVPLRPASRGSGHL